MRKNLIVIILLIAGMGGLFLAQESRIGKKSHPDDEESARFELDSLRLLMDTLAEAENHEQIIKVSEKAEELILSNVQDSFYLSFFRKYRGDANYYLGDYAKSIDEYNGAIAATTETEEGLKQRATQLFDRANAEYQLKLMADCYQSTLASEAILSKLENPDYDYLISVYNDLAYQSRELAFYDDARKFLNKARAIYNSRKDIVDAFDIPVRKPVAFAYSEVLINAEAEDEAEMLASMSKLEALVEGRTSTKSEYVRLSSAYAAVADFYINDLHAFSEEKVRNAKHYTRLAWKTLDIDENPRGFDQLRFNEAKMSYNIGNYIDSKRQFEKLCIELTENDTRRPFFEAMKALSYMKLGEDEKAIQSFWRTLTITHVGEEPLKEDCSNYKSSTDIIHATLFAELADTLRANNKIVFDAVGNQLHLAGISEFKSNYQGKTFNERLKATYESLFQGALEPVLKNKDARSRVQELATILNESETIENRLLWSKFLLNRRMGELKVPDSVRRSEQMLRLNIVKARRSGDAQLCFELENELEKLERSILKEYPNYGAFSQSHFDVNALQESLSTDELVIKFVQFNKAIYRFDIDQTTIQCTRLNHSEEVRSKVREYLTVIQDRKEDRKLAGELTMLLLPKDYSTYAKVTVVNNLVLGGLPFEALCTEKRRYLVEQSMITYAPHLIFINGDAPSNSKGNVVVFYAGASKSETSLPGAERETELIIDQFSSDYFGEQEATREAFMKVSTDASIVHLSMHAEINEDIGEQSCFLFNDEKLYLDELYGLNLSGQMAVLSACNTGRSFKDVRNGNASLQRAFMYAGIPSTLSSLWEIPDHTTQKIMKLFYEGLNNGMTNGEAIQKAKQGFLSQVDDPHLRAPYFWAGFVLSGKDQKISLEPSSKNAFNWQKIALVFGVFSIVFLIWRRLWKRKSSFFSN